MEISVCACVLNHSAMSDYFVAPWTIAHQASLSMGFSRQGYWSGLPFPPPGSFPNPGVEPMSPISPALQVDYLPAEPSGIPAIWNNMGRLEGIMLSEVSHTKTNIV